MVPGLVRLGEEDPFPKHLTPLRTDYCIRLDAEGQSDLVMAQSSVVILARLAGDGCMLDRLPGW